MAKRSPARTASRPMTRSGGVKTRSMTEKSTKRKSSNERKSGNVLKVARNYRIRPARSASKKSPVRRIGVERFHNRIMRIKNDLSPKLRVQKRTVDLMNALLNDILRNVTLKARINTHQYRKKTITFTDVYVAAMNLFGESNKWIDKIMSAGEKKAEDYKN